MYYYYYYGYNYYYQQLRRNQNPSVPVSKSTRSSLEEEWTVGYVTLRSKVLRVHCHRSLRVHPRATIIQL